MPKRCRSLPNSLFWCAPLFRSDIEWKWYIKKKGLDIDIPVHFRFDLLTSQKFLYFLKGFLIYFSFISAFIIDSRLSAFNCLWATRCFSSPAVMGHKRKGFYQKILFWHCWSSFYAYDCRSTALNLCNKFIVVLDPWCSQF